MQTTSSRSFLIAGATSAALAVVIGAFGAHALQGRVAPPLLATYHTANQYHFYHSLGLIALALLDGRMSSAWLRWAGMLMLAGIVLFCGSLYLLSVTGLTILGAITPFGGLAFIAAWSAVAIGAARRAP